MSEPALAMPIVEVPRPGLSVDDAVRAALRGRATEARSFRNEDDLEGPRGLPAEELGAAPAP